jgi:hypothetical protein
MLERLHRDGERFIDYQYLCGKSAMAVANDEPNVHPLEYIPFSGW